MILYNIYCTLITALALATPPVGEKQGKIEDRPWTMDECIAYALEHSHAVRASEVQVKVAKAEALGAKVGFLPSVSAQAGTQWSWGRNVSPETNTYANITTFNSGFGVYASMNLFDGGRIIHQWHQAQAAKKRTMSDMQIARDNKAFEVMQAYIDAVYLHGCIELAEEELKESEEMLRKTKVLEEVGMKGAPDVAQMESRKAESEYNLTQQKNLMATAMMQLRRIMAMGNDEQFAIATSGTLAPPKLSGSAAERFLSAKNKLEESRFSYKYAQGLLLPSLSLQAGVSTNYFKSLKGGQTSPSFGSQMANNLGEYIGISLNIPLFAFGSLTSVKRAKLNYKRAQIAYEETMMQLSNDKRQAEMDCRALHVEIDKMERKVLADEATYHLNTRKYEEGLMSAVELQTTANMLLQSRVTLLQKRMLVIIKEKLVEYYR